MENEWDIVIKLIFAALLGSLIGFERRYIGKEAGIKTYALVALGAALFTILGREAISYFYLPNLNIPYDAGRILSYIVMGVGFLGSGIILHQGLHIKGLTTAAGVWVTAAIGIAAALGLFLIAAFTSFFVLVIFMVVKRLEKHMFKTK